VLLLQDDLLHELCAADPVAASAAAVSAGAHVSHPARGSDRAFSREALQRHGGAGFRTWTYTI
jgi:hypothetical protein